MAALASGSTVSSRCVDPTGAADRTRMRCGVSASSAVPAIDGRRARAPRSLTDDEKIAALPDHLEGKDLIGTEAPALHLERWMNSALLEMPALRGHVVLIRWWTDACPYCEASAPALVALDREYRSRGLVVIGVFHPKPPGDRSVERMKRAAGRFGFTFPVALDADWDALRSWWLDREPRGWTSVSFIVDREGRIRYVHPGGEYHEGEGGDHLDDHSACRRDYAEIKSTIVRLLGEATRGGVAHEPRGGR